MYAEDPTSVCRNASVSAKLPIHSFINDMDIVPQLLESTKIMTLLQVVQLMLPLRKCAAKQTGKFMAVGTVYLLLHDRIHAFDTHADGANLAQTVEQLFVRVSGRSHKRSEGDEMIMRLLQDHLLARYTSKMQAAVLHTVPVLFLGGQFQDYEAVPIKRMSPSAGTPCCISSMCMQAVLSQTCTLIYTCTAGPEKY